MSLTCPTCGKTAQPAARFCPYDGAKLEERSTDPLVGRLIGGRYRVSHRIGSGGMARVYRAHHGALGADVAFKVLHADLAEDHVFVARFAREAEAIGRIDHGNVVSLLDFGRAFEEGLEPFFYLVMELVPGRPLDTELRGGALHPARAAHILSQIAAGVARAHELGIVHRDLKPQNVMLRQRGADRDFVTILDFGLSRTVEPDPQMPALTNVSDVLGTPQYMAPERWAGGHLDMRSDIYALGVIGYELLTGTMPFEGTVVELVFKHSLEAPTPPSAKVPDIPRALDHAILRCLEKKADDRFQSAEELLAALGEAWKELGRRSARTTYAATRAAPPRPSTDAVPDPTLWHSNEMDALEDGPAVVEEIAHLHALRRRHLADLADALWPSRKPTHVSALRAEITDIERRMEQREQEIALIESELEDYGRAIRGQEAELRGEIIRFNVAMTCPTPIDDADDTQPMDPERVAEILDSPNAGERVKRAEKALASLQRKQVKEQIDRRLRLGETIGDLRKLEGELAPRYEQLARALETEIPRGSALAERLVLFQKVDGAIAAYEGLLSSLEDRAR